MKLGDVCDHPEFRAVSRVQRFAEMEGGPIVAYAVEVTISCVRCHLPFHFKGLPAGSRPDAPSVSIDGTELRAPIGPGEIEL